MGDSPPVVPGYIDKILKFPDGSSYELLRPLATYRSCHDGTPAEARIVLTCQRTEADSASTDEYVVKIKIHTTTAHELKALKKFHDASSQYTPVLVNFMSVVQPAEGPLPGGYLTFLVMTKMPGDSLFNMYYWGMSDEERKQIRESFLVALNWIYEQGIEPVDCGLRNILWERGSKKCTIIDFELWRDTDASFGDEIKELQRWGLVRQPAAKNHWDAWNQMFR
ncbi:hypothetical protein CLCR_05088 [Cladophialophora carrionii]|uniref:Protein kinase domain-containing protein n=1 Tax=Cladophialophora carrionii TaxID=86049 RepID=A0A1C1CL63_9EURO|nr:hypothetical protein CLCR_05088 [Cladophialophora carrionii]